MNINWFPQFDQSEDFYKIDYSEIPCSGLSYINLNLSKNKTGYDTIFKIYFVETEKYITYAYRFNFLQIYIYL